MEVVNVVQRNMRKAQSRQKSYANKYRRPLEFEVCEMVFLKASPMKFIARFRLQGKLSARNIEPYEILERISRAAYRIALPL